MQNLFAIFGNPVSHSKSPLMHNRCFAHFKEKSCYTRILLKNGEDLKARFFALGLSGANITVPHKEAAFAACDVIDEDAKAIGAINTIIEKNGKLHGYNTDAPGFMLSIEEFSREKVLLLGAGGTAKAIAYIMNKRGLDVTVMNRSAGRLEGFNHCETMTWENFENRGFDLVVNTTSAGLADGNLPVPEAMIGGVLENAKACVDVIYGKQTPFLQAAQKRGLEVKDGADMLLYQGVLAFEHFTGHRYGTREITPVMRKAFEL